MCLYEIKINNNNKRTRVYNKITQTNIKKTIHSQKLFFLFPMFIIFLF